MWQTFNQNFSSLGYFLLFCQFAVKKKIFSNIAQPDFARTRIVEFQIVYETVFIRILLKKSYVINY